MLLVVYLVTSLLVRSITGERILQLEDTLVEAREEMRFRATHDVLTGLWNRGVILELLQRELQRGRRDHQNGSVTIILADIDHFKSQRYVRARRG